MSCLLIVTSLHWFQLMFARVPITLTKFPCVSDCSIPVAGCAAITSLDVSCFPYQLTVFLALSFVLFSYLLFVTHSFLFRLSCRLEFYLLPVTSSSSLSLFASILLQCGCCINHIWAANQTTIPPNLSLALIYIIHSVWEVYIFANFCKSHKPLAYKKVLTKFVHNNIRYRHKLRHKTKENQ